MTDNETETPETGPVRSRTLCTLFTDEDDTMIAIDHVYLAEGEAGTCAHCGKPAHDPGLVGLVVGEETALLTPGEALILANRLERAAGLVLESEEDPPDIEREAARLSPVSRPEDPS